MSTSSIVKRVGRRGFTLLEVIVASFLAAIVLTILARVTGLLYRIGHEEVERGAFQARALLAVKKLEDDLTNTSPAGVGLSSSKKQLVIHPLGEVLPSGRVLFQESFTLWNWDLPGGAQEGRLTRSELASRPDGKPFDGGPFRWPVATMPPAVGAKISMSLENVTKFEVTNPAGVALPQVGSPVTVLVEVNLPLATTRKTVTATRSVQIRTSGV